MFIPVLHTWTWTCLAIRLCKQQGLSQVGWRACVKFQVLPQILKCLPVWALTGLHWTFRDIVRMKGDLQVQCRVFFFQVFFQDCLEFCFIHAPTNSDQLLCPYWYKSSHDTATTMFQDEDVTFRGMWSVCFSPHITFYAVENFHFGLCWTTKRKGVSKIIKINKNISSTKLSLQKSSSIIYPILLALS